MTLTRSMNLSYIQRMIKRFFQLLFIFITTLLLIIYFQPDHFKVSRSLIINSSAQSIYQNINNLKLWDNWSPWAKLDPNATIKFSEPEEGVGASFSWKGNEQVGEGSVTIIESNPPTLIKYRLDFVLPFQNSNLADFSITPMGETSNVTWSMYGENNFIGKAISLFIDCDKMIGDQFTKGLNNLKSFTEKN